MASNLMADCRVIAPAKINLHLEVLGLRPDGYHELAMLMQSIDLADQLDFVGRSDGEISLRCNRSELPLGPDNLIVQAAERLRAHAGLEEQGVAILLEKRIPIGAGLAGGSSDAAATLIGLDRLWGLGTPRPVLAELAAQLGSDVPFCLEGGSQLCFGRGERLEACPGPTPPLGVLLLKHPQVSVSTPWAYGRCREWRGDFYLSQEADFEQRRQALRQSPLLQGLRGQAPLPPLRNDLQAVVAPEVSSVALALELLQQRPEAMAVAMSGSGPTVFGLFGTVQAAGQVQEALAEALQVAGLESWCCALRDSGVSLVEAALP
ncbi:MAG: 4-(cytidine 5'-diphospho)-2-C-methyl-D-erythritol kinase [Cyanobacteriota bacterium]|nr:4-(cytidine 5'-diphospho)-2-C-methyl-D-erythritol kinase [Cyanobacteriota bacterium]